MRQSQLFSKTLKEAPKDEISANAKLLVRGGFIYKNSAGIYTFLPLGWLVIQKIAAIIREEMNAIGGIEMFMQALVDKRYWDASGRWGAAVGFKTQSRYGGEFSLGWTHEEVIAEIVSKYASSYKDLPIALYQIQTKFRDEKRPKSGILRGREFLMKDLYSFHTSEEDLRRYYNEVRRAYEKIFKRCGLEAIYTEAAGGAFTISNTHEFQVITPAGEDTIFICANCHYAENREISKLKEGGRCLRCGGIIKKEKSIEVGNIFPLGTKYSKAFNLKFKDQNGNQKYVVMGSYGIGLGRLMGTIVEIYHDDKGILWPESVAPMTAHLLFVGTSSGLKKEAERLYNKLVKKGVAILYDDRNISAGEKFFDADLIGLPYRLVLSEKTLAKKSVEITKRTDKKTRLVKVEAVENLFSK